MKVQACKEGRELKLISKGECSEKIARACKDANCTNYELCEIDNQNRAICICQSNCSPIFVPVCGISAGYSVTYGSICELKKNSCQLKQEISILNYGICGQATCDNTCNFGSICVINSTTFEPYCTCDENCSMEYQPLCASDGLTYTNPCFLKRKACKNQKDIHQLYNGQCRGCMLHKCEHYSTCKINQVTDKPECICLFDCDQNNTTTEHSLSKSQAICATDKDGNKQIYSSECELKKKSCETKTDLTILPDLSNCELCKNVHCKYRAFCSSNGKCVCPLDCPKELYEPVCSNFGQTFNNECELRKAACQNSKNPNTGTLNYEKLDNHTILFYGECNKQPHQNSNEDSKVISISGKSSILISGQMVGNYVGSTMCNENSCKYGGRCYYDENGKPTCLCLFDCPIQKTDKKQCGNDGRLYLNNCKLQEEICLRQQTIKVLPLKECLTNRNYSICGGSLPEVDKLSGKFIDCNKKSLFFKECASNYTCLHHRKVISSIRTLLTFKEQDHFCCLKQEIDQSNPNEFSNLIEEQQNKCNCNKLGSELPMRCDEKGQCECKSGVDGLQCTRCKVGYYGFHKLSQGNRGCIPCSCDKNGRVREDCNQSTGQCICKIDVTGMKCDTCPTGKKLTSTGCVDEALLKVHNKRCSSLRCRFGSICKEISPNKSQCVCNHSCRRKFLNEPTYQKRFERDDHHSYLDDHYFNHILKNTKRDKSKYKYLSRPLCGSDNNTHLNECEMRIHACRSQRKIVKVKDGQCTSLSNELNNNSLDNWQSPVTQTPVRRSTLEKDKSFYDLVDEVSNTNLYSQTESSLIVNQYTNMYEEERSNFNPMFTGRSFIRLSRIEVNDYLKLEIELIAFSDRGIIFYSDQSSKGLGDFISLTLCNGYFEYRFNLGSGISTLRSKEKVQKYVPTLVTVIKDFKKGSLIVNNQPEVSCVSEGNWKNLDLNENFYLGWIRTNYEKVYENLNGIRTGFIGCILKLELGKNEKELKNVELINLNSINYDYKSTASIQINMDNNVNTYSRQSKMKILETESINNCSSLTKNKINFCSKHNPCSKSSICVNLPNNTFDCVCPSNLDRCLNIRNEVLVGKQVGQDNQPIDFWSESWIKSKNLLTNINRAFSIEIWFLSRSKDGLLIYAQKGRKGDFLSLNIKDSKMEFIFNLGSKVKNLR